MLRRSPLKVRKEEYFTVYQYIIGDTALDPSENVVPAYKANPNKPESDDPDERLLNKVISKPRVSSEHVNGMWKRQFPWLRLIPNRVRDKKSLTEVMKYIHCTVLLHNFLIEFGDQHIKSWRSEEDRLSDIAEPANDPTTDDMPGEEHMLHRGVPGGSTCENIMQLLNLSVRLGKMIAVMMKGEIFLQLQQSLKITSTN
eukprot:g13503.t1 g13503   contig8:825945-826541(-)